MDQIIKYISSTSQFKSPVIIRDKTHFQDWNIDIALYSQEDYRRENIWLCFVDEKNVGNEVIQNFDYYIFHLPETEVTLNICYKISVPSIFLINQTEQTDQTVKESEYESVSDQTINYITVI